MKTVKRIVTILFTWVVLAVTVMAQSPQKVSYQSVIRDNTGALVKSQAVGIRISILQGSSSGSAVYVERHTPTTNTNGLVSFDIGAGTVVSGTFSSINWGSGSYFLKVETDPSGGTTYSITGTSQILSIPYALYSNRSAYTDHETDPVFGSSVAAGITAQDTANWNNNSYAGILERLLHIEQTLFTTPTLTTSAVTAVTIDKAACGGTVTNDGGMNVTVRGLCWNTTGTPTVADSKTISGSGTGAFTDTLRSLIHNTTYYVRAYATNGIGTSYGSQVSFATLRDTDLPVATTSAVSNITKTTALGGGEVTSEGNTSVTARGVCWNTTGNPTTSNSKTINGTGAGSFSSTITLLTPGTTYYLKAYATNAKGTSYGNQITFTTLSEPGVVVYDTITDSRDHKKYRIFTIGTQVWMADNLAYLPSVSPATTGSEIDTYYYVYGYNGADTAAAKATTEYLSYGVLYNWPAAMNGSLSSSNNPSGVQGVCPTGWHLPSAAEWNTFENYLIAGAYNYDGTVTGDKIAKALANKTGWTTSTTVGAPGYSPTTNNSSGFSGIPVGYRLSSSSFGSAGTEGSWWSSYEASSSTAWSRILNYNAISFDEASPNKAEGRNVRCVKNDGVSYTVPTLTTTAISNLSSVTATSGGTISTDGGASVTVRGVCWNTTGTPTVSNNKTTDGTGTGSFTSSLTGLSASTTYYLRAYATNNVGTAYGQQITFTTTAQAVTLPTISTTVISNIGQTTATGGGNVTSEGSSSVTARGVCWSTSQNPTTSNSKTSDGTGSGSFTSTLTGLTASTTYYVRAYATSSAGTAYGTQTSFTTATQIGTMPTVTTTAISNITQVSATGGGNVTSAGTTSVTAKGVCWSTAQNPTIADSKTDEGAGIGTYTSTLTGLTTSTTYYVRAYATNTTGTAYGEQVSFTTASPTLSLPTVTTTTISSIAQTTASGGGNVTAIGTSAVTAKGVCWSTAENPTTSNSKTTDGSGIGSFTSSLTGLLPSTTYYVRAYATNTSGTSYGGQVSFTTSALAANTFVDTRDSKIYKTITIGTQTWMAENLAYLPSVNLITNSTTVPLYYVYGYTGTTVTDAKASASYTTYGALYNWPAASTACPSGWALPTLTQWQTLRDYLIAQGYNYDGTTSLNKVAKAMASKTNWTASGVTGTPGYDVTTNNGSGFNGAPSGYADYSLVNFGNQGVQANWWGNSTGTDNANAVFLLNNNIGFLSGSTFKAWGYSVRCIKVE